MVATSWLAEPVELLSDPVQPIKKQTDIKHIIIIAVVIFSVILFSNQFLPYEELFCFIECKKFTPLIIEQIQFKILYGISPNIIAAIIPRNSHFMKIYFYHAYTVFTISSPGPTRNRNAMSPPIDNSVEQNPFCRSATPLQIF